MQIWCRMTKVLIAKSHFDHPWYIFNEIRYAGLALMYFSIQSTGEVFAF